MASLRVQQTASFHSCGAFCLSLLLHFCPTNDEEIRCNFVGCNNKLFFKEDLRHANLIILHLIIVTIILDSFLVLLFFNYCYLKIFFLNSFSESTTFYPLLLSWLQLRHQPSMHFSQNLGRKITKGLNYNWVWIIDFSKP